VEEVYRDGKIAVRTKSSGRAVSCSK